MLKQLLKSISLKYLSASSFFALKNSPYTWVAKKLKIMDYDEQSVPASNGTAFDILVKNRLYDLGIKPKSLTLDEIGKSLQANHTEALKIGYDILKVYEASTLLSRTKFVGTENHLFRQFHGLKLFGQLDSEVDELGYRLPVPLDWKVTGSNSKNGVSPQKLYWDIFDGETWKGCHKKYEMNIPFHLIKYEWAVQLCIYGWLLGYELGEEFPAYIHQVTFKGVDLIINISVYRGIITKKFQLELFKELMTIWTNSFSGNYLTFENGDYPVVGKGLIKSVRDIKNWILIGASNETWF